MQVRIKRLNDTATIPTFGSADAAGCDLYANLASEGGSVTIAPGVTYLVKTGIAMEIPKNYAGFIYARSGLASKRGLRPANCVGVIDSDYRGEVMVALHNDSQTEQTINHGERIAQMVIGPYIRPEFVEADDLTDTERGDGGFGSTGYFFNNFGHKNEEEYLAEIAEWLGSGCAKPELWENDGSKCHMCEWFTSCAEGAYMIAHPNE